MAVINKAIEVCDICENEVKNFYYWENTTSPFGVLSESKLVIDICEHCAREIRFDIPKNMMLERYGSDTASRDEIQGKIKEWRKLVLEG